MQPTSMVTLYKFIEHATIKGETVGVKSGLDAASTTRMTRHHALINRACDASTPLENLTNIRVDESISAGELRYYTTCAILSGDTIQLKKPSQSSSAV